ncbi:hypothetical protein A4X09_0g6777 [Tilletia walkeri]|uniref:Uncharacterized protein n=1 Tax=Tilletia walkeri TaxID=117179 RepID=A0A8X7T2A9_9BASI|nr:hypothetical protein A4X09_0g6777 [Tilletia walkeri]
MMSTRIFPSSSRIASLSRTARLPPALSARTLPTITQRSASTQPPSPSPSHEKAEEQGHPKPKRPYSQLQKSVFALYRRAYRLIRTKPEETQFHFLLYLRHAFKQPSQGGSIGRRDFSAIEHLLRRGERMVDQVFAEKGVKDVHLPGYVIEEVKREQERRAREIEEAGKKEQALPKR